MSAMIDRLRATKILGVAMSALGDRSGQRRIAAADAARLERIGDIEGQTARAVAFAAELDKKLLAK